MSEEQQDNLSKLQDAIDKLREGIGDLLVQKAAKSLAIVDASEKTYAEKKKEKESQLKIWDFFKAYEDALPDEGAVEARRNHLLCKDDPTWEEPKEGKDGELPPLPQDGPLQPLWPMEEALPDEEAVEASTDEETDKKPKKWQRWSPEAGKPLPPSLNVWFSHWLMQLLANQGISTQFRPSREDVPKANYGNLTCRNTALLVAMLFPGIRKVKPKDEFPSDETPRPWKAQWIGLNYGRDKNYATSAFLEEALWLCNPKVRKSIWGKEVGETHASFWKLLLEEACGSEREGFPYASLMTEVATLGRLLMGFLLEKRWRSSKWDSLADARRLHAAELLLSKFHEEGVLGDFERVAPFERLSSKQLRNLRIKDKRGTWRSPVQEGGYLEEAKGSILGLLPSEGKRGAYPKCKFRCLGVQDNKKVIPLNDAQFGLFWGLPHVASNAPSLIEREDYFIRRGEKIETSLPLPGKRTFNQDNVKKLLRQIRLFLLLDNPTEQEKTTAFLIPGLERKADLPTYEIVAPKSETGLDYNELENFSGRDKKKKSWLEFLETDGFFKDYLRGKEGARKLNEMGDNNLKEEDILLLREIFLHLGPAMLQYCTWYGCGFKEVWGGLPGDDTSDESLSLGIKERKSAETMRYLHTLNGILNFASDPEMSLELYHILKDYCGDKKEDDFWLQDMVQKLEEQMDVFEPNAEQIKGAIQQLCENTLELSSAPRFPFIDFFDVFIREALDPTGEKELQRLGEELDKPEVRAQFIGELRAKETIRVRGEGEENLYPSRTGTKEAKSVLFKRLKDLPRHELKDAVLDGCVEQYSKWVEAFWSSENAGILSDQPPKKDKRPFRERMVEFLCELLPQLIVARKENAGRKPSEGK